MGVCCSVLDSRERRCERFGKAVAACDVRSAMAELTDPSMLEWRNLSGRTPLEVAVLQRHEPMIEFLLERGANPDCGTTLDTDPVFMACYYGWTYILRQILRSSPYLADKKKTKGLFTLQGEQRWVTFAPVHIMSLSPKALQVLEVLADSDADVCAPDSRGNTALHHAARATPLCLRFFRALLRVCVSRGMDLDGLNNSGHPALDYALRTGNVRAATELLRCGASMRALKDPSPRILRLLLAAAPNRRAAMAFAAEHKHPHLLYRDPLPPAPAELHPSAALIAELQDCPASGAARQEAAALATEPVALFAAPAGSLQ